MMNSNTSTVSTRSFPWLLWLFVFAALIGINAYTQPFEDAVSLVPPTIAYYLDYIWYLDDIIGPSLFMVAGLMMLIASRGSLKEWAVMGLGLSCIAFSLGDTMDVHWMLAMELEAETYAITFSSWMSKVMVVITFCFFMVQAYDRYPRPAQRAMLFAFLLLFIDQIQMSISFDFAGYYFHVFEESMEVVTAMILAFGVGRYKLLDQG